MGNATSSAISKEILEDLKLTTKFTEQEISQWYENFQKQCPSGRISPGEFEEIYARFFPDSDPKSYARHVFRSFDTNDDGTLDFKEYIIALHMTSTGRTTRKLEWAFSLFDVDKNGYITKTEVKEICQVSVVQFIKATLMNGWVALMVLVWQQAVNVNSYPVRKRFILNIDLFFLFWLLLIPKPPKT